ncbi:MAG: cytochrome c family protein [candidate division KSB1 bacterium]|nr:cytochrome c family protein [candidate division KSB1 bacterium]
MRNAVRASWLPIAVIPALASLLWLGAWGQSRKELIKFSHRKHVREVGAECNVCHAEAAESKESSDRLLPTMEQCGSCHDVTDEKQCLLCHVSQDRLEALANPVRSFRFSHATHVAETRLQCLACHKGIDEVDLGDGKKIPPRESCNVCHNGTLVSQECQLCHVGEVEILPLDHASDWAHEHMVRLRAGGEKDCAHCHQNRECQDCHEAVDLVTAKVLPTEYFASFRPASGQTPLVLSRVHDLNYRFWHSLEAEGKAEQCQVCHEGNRTCVECHTERSRAGAFLHRPAWHGGPDWGARRGAVGSGGGKHAELAERDIERCAACHDVQGSDPNCLLCHTDFDGVRGTDPRTHGAGFADRFGEGAEFHHDAGAVCFNCHVRARAGEGFCGYCHGKK